MIFWKTIVTPLLVLVFAASASAAPAEEAPDALMDNPYWIACSKIILPEIVLEEVTSGEAIAALTKYVALQNPDGPSVNIATQLPLEYPGWYALTRLASQISAIEGERETLAKAGLGPRHPKMQGINRTLQDQYEMLAPTKRLTLHMREVSVTNIIRSIAELQELEVQILGNSILLKAED